MPKFTLKCDFSDSTHSVEFTKDTLSDVYEHLALFFNGCGYSTHQDEYGDLCIGKEPKEDWVHTDKEGNTDD